MRPFRSRITAALFAVVAVIAIARVATTAPADDAHVVKEGNTYKLKIGDTTVAESPEPIQVKKTVPVPWSAKRVHTFTTKSKADGPTVSYYVLELGGGNFLAPKSTTYRIRLQSRTFDPTEPAPLTDPDLPDLFHPSPNNKLYLVQFHSQPLDEFRKGIRDAGGELRSYVAELSYVVRMDAAAVERVKALAYVRAVVPLLPTDKLERSLLKSLTTAVNVNRDNPVPRGVKVQYLLTPTSREDRPSLMAGLTALGGTVVDPNLPAGSVTAALTAEQVAKAASLNFVQWIEVAKKPEVDVDNARVVGGADHLAALPAGYTGIGIRGHVLEGIFADHPDFAAKATRVAPIAVDDPASNSHGQCTFGEIFGDGKTKPTARGLLPDAQGYYTHNNVTLAAPTGSHGARFVLVKKLIDDHQVLFQTASWGNGRDTAYTGYSADMDELIFELDMPITQSQSNSGTQLSRPQAWAKNIISVGGAFHFDNTTDADDRWNGGASIGPAEDGRVKPDLCFFYDKIQTTDGPTSHTNDFCCTSGATPLVAGHVGLCLEMYTNGIFPGCKLPKPPKPENRFENRPHFSMVKALLIASASRYEFPPTTDLDRFRQGWGRPNLRTLYDLREKSLIVNETDILKNLEKKSYRVRVNASEPSLRVTMTYPDPPHSPLARGHHRVNNLDLKVTDPTGQVYWGNFGLLNGNESMPGGTPNTIDTVENVFLSNPKRGVWTVEVIADELVQDGHLKTAELDAAYALVVLGVNR